MLISLVLRKTDAPKWVHRWFDRVSVLLEENPSVDIQMDTVFFMSLYYLWKGEYHKNGILLEKAEAGILGRELSPFAAIRIKMMKGIHCWVTAQYEAALSTLSEGLNISEKSGVHMFDSLMWGFRVAAETASGNMEAAGQSLKHQMTTSVEAGKTLSIFFYHLNAAWHGVLNGSTSLAAENLGTIASRVAKMGTPYYRALWNIAMAQVAFLQGRPGEAKTLIHAAHRISRNMKSQVLEWYSLLVDSYFLLEEGEEKKGLSSLRRALAMARRHGYVHLEFYQPAVMQFLCAKALGEGIEREFVKGLIGKLGLTPPQSPGLDGSIEDWPYPVGIVTLGRFEVLSDGNPIAVAGKTQKKPLEMLKAIISFGGTNVSGDRLSDALWPDADGDLAHKSFEMTLSRLRKLLGGEGFVKYRAGRLSLDLFRCRVDSLVLEHLIREIRISPDDRIVVLCEKAIKLYEGPFLSSDADMPWTAHRREMLKNGLLRAIIAAGRHYENAGQWERAVEYYLKGLDIDNLAEEFYQRLMVCYGRLGNNADIVRTYHRCRSYLCDNLGIEPSSETEAIFSSLLQKN
jgi:LuxR family maltose regulon positive regulatory protein